jgi:surfeit locus 1 family protein
MRRVPLVPTILVALAVTAMIALGCWQLFDRLPQKEALLRELAANPARPPIAFPRLAQGDDLLFRRASGFCLRVTGWESQAGRSTGGATGWRMIARCATGAEGPGITVQMGVASNPQTRTGWTGGKVSGYLTYAPDHDPAIARAFGGGTPRTLMLVSATPAPGLQPNAPPDLDAVPNNHLAYAVQWFLFAAVAAVIYAIALRRRGPKASLAGKS